MRGGRNILVHLLCCYITWSWSTATGDTNDQNGGSVKEGPAPAWLEERYKLGGDLVLSCAPANGGDVAGNSYIWRVNGSVVEAGGRYTLVGADSELRVSSAGEGDHGEYSCSVRPLAEDEPYLARRWRVSAVPELSLPATETVAPGDTLVLTCTVRGLPRPALSWWHEERAVSPAQDARVSLRAADSTLAVSAMRREDAGRYTCRAGNVTASTDVLVDESEGGSGGGMSGGAVVGVVLGVLAAGALVALGALAVLRRRRGEPLAADCRSWRKLLALESTARAASPPRDDPHETR